MEWRSTVDDFGRRPFTFDVVESLNVENCPFEILCDEPNCVYQPEIINALKPNAEEYFNYALDLPLSWTLSPVQNSKKLPERYTREEKRTRILRYQEKKKMGQSARNMLLNVVICVAKFLLKDVHGIMESLKRY